jgi:energy-coupling factor transporter ATP-binding protein EcfA2
MESIPFRFADGDWSIHMQRLRSMGYHASITGPKGSGKTTLLAELQVRLNSGSGTALLARAPLSRARQSEWVTGLLDQKRQGVILLVDCGERLSPGCRRRLRGSCRDARGGLIMTVHRRSRLPVWIHCQSSLDTLDYLQQELVGPLPAPLGQHVWSDALLAWQHCQGNLRDVIRALYDQAAAGKYGPAIARDRFRQVRR